VISEVTGLTNYSRQIDTGKEGDRVFLLQYNNSPRRFFFWAQVKGGNKIETWNYLYPTIQAKDSSKDDENVTKINEYINNPASATASQPSDGLDANALMQMLQGR
jgi:hypothetical protein